MTPKIELPSSLASAVGDAATAWERVYRLVNLKQAVNAKLDKKNYTPIREIPLQLQQAIIAVEDSRFYTHNGFDVEGILRAMLVNMQSGSVVEGASTISQQLIKNLFLSQDRTYLRKAEELALSVVLETNYSKEEILEMYLNTIYFGSGAYGISNAASIYFDRAPANLNVAESSLLAGLPNAPSLYSPYVNLTAAKQRQAVVLAAMVRQGYIGPALAEEIRNTPLKFAK
ncbi:MAG TPA: transglycosylase domain-containing protein [Patescibacteria group bacterium]|nr:transglycosylase domain-containing protein [Patescibacteria group bacterium]